MSRHHLEVARLDSNARVVSLVHVLDREQLSRKLRISLTDRCNLSCFFCHNEGQAPPTHAGSNQLSIDELTRIVRAAIGAGIREIKLTGGEPLLYRDGSGTIVDLIRALASLRSEPFGLSLTTNGVLLNRFAGQLKDAGLDRVTVSMHTLDQSRFSSLIAPTIRKGAPSAILSAIRSAVEIGLTPVKVNTVIFGQSGEGNASEIRSIIRACRSIGVSALRLYTLLNHQDFADHARWYRPMDEDLLQEIGAALYNSPQTGGEFATRVLSFIEEWKHNVYPKPTLVVNANGLDVEIEPMESGRFEKLGLGDEGPYALRLSARGELKGALEGDKNTIQLREWLRDGDDDALRETFCIARSSLLPK